MRLGLRLGLRLDPHTALICWLIDRSGEGLPDDPTPEQIAKKRAAVHPHWWPASLLTGAVRRDVRIEDHTLPLPDAPLRCRVYTPRRATPGPLPLVVYLHGGGWVTGNVRSYDAVCSQIAAGANAVVASVDYRMAPEHRCPTAAEDTYAATVFLAEHAADFGADGNRVAVAGDSAGGNLAAVVAQLARDRGGPALRLQVLVYPATDGRLGSPSIDENAHGPLLTRRAVHNYLALYAGPGGDLDDPRLSPLLAADLAGLAPALVQTADADPIRDDGRRYAAALEAAGVPTRWTEYVRAPHGYINIPGAVRGGRQALAEIVQELRRHLAQH